MLTGTCLCGAVRWKIDSGVSRMTHCHCSMCRKAHGAPFGTYTEVQAENFHWLSGEDAIVNYQSSPGVARSFCGRCGSVAPEPYGDGTYAIPVGALNEDPGIKASAHIFASNKAPWHIIAGDLEQHDGFPDPADNPDIDRPVQASATDGVLRGSCLCGDIAYEVTTPISAVYNCHCNRCQKARAAAHTTNGFTAADGVKFVRGEDRLVTYKLPDAKHFTQVFCSRCGSPMPRVNRERNVAVIPFGSLDNDPGRGADQHIFTGSKAPWYDIEDDLPQSVAMPD